MTEQQSQIWNYLTEHSVGISNAIHIADLAEALGFEPYGTNNDDLRGIIKDMVMEELLPIGTCQDGVFIFTNEAERESAARFVERQTRANVVRDISPYNNLKSKKYEK
jgi:hypothetical protein